jgi:hypothetical protein
MRLFSFQFILCQRRATGFESYYTTVGLRFGVVRQPHDEGM